MEFDDQSKTEILAEHFYSKIESFIKNRFFFVKKRNFGYKSKFWSKIGINRNFGQKSGLIETLVTNQNFGQKSGLIEILVTNQNVCPKSGLIKIFTKKQFFVKNRKFCQK